MHLLFDPQKPVDLTNTAFPESWTNYYRLNDFSAIAYFYFNKPKYELPALQTLDIRTVNLKGPMHQK